MMQEATSQQKPYRLLDINCKQCPWRKRCIKHQYMQLCKVL